MDKEIDELEKMKKALDKARKGDKTAIKQLREEYGYTDYALRMDGVNIPYKNHKNKRVFICPNNDLESFEIIALLLKNGEEVLVTSQTWGASWENLEDPIKELAMEAMREGEEVYGIELQGNFQGAKNIDHHVYGEDDRSSEKSSIEQVTDIIGVELSIDEKFVAANDKGYIPEMEKLGKQLEIKGYELQEIICYIRARDRQKQGVTFEQEAQAEEAVSKLGEIKEKRDYILIEGLPHSKTSTITDRLYGKYDNLLVTSQDGETNFFGTTEIIKMLNEKFPGGWSGGQLDQGAGFWGGYADQEKIKQEVEKIIQSQRKNSKSNDKNHSFHE